MYVCIASTHGGIVIMFFSFDSVVPEKKKEKEVRLGPRVPHVNPVV